MTQHVLMRICALACSAALGVALTPSCTFRFGTGSEDADRSDDLTDFSDPGEEENAPRSPTEPASEEDVFTDAIASADPLQLAVATARTSYALYLLDGSIESEGVAPESLDEMALSMLVERYLPWALEQADAWVATMDPAFLPALPMGYIVRYECADEFGCPYSHKVWSRSKQRWAVCGPNDCGDGRCKPCPEWFGSLANLAVKGWCSYVCIVDAEVVGSAGTIISSFRGVPVSFSYIDVEWKMLK
ncbi:hypothetical protein BE21_55045 [Sorangium cellulosum]|uniref:Uncharacterized protein n=1 Tax=Sorangium cellulosum TaxID=56 RepID=A0A150TC80_SORCE|nr:hypothetical protein BE21_55045 [Sorangium cellulosum]